MGERIVQPTQRRLDGGLHDIWVGAELALQSGQPVGDQWLHVADRQRANREAGLLEGDWLVVEIPHHRVHPMAEQRRHLGVADVLYGDVGLREARALEQRQQAEIGGAIGAGDAHRVAAQVRRAVDRRASRHDQRHRVLRKHVGDVDHRHGAAAHLCDLVTAGEDQILFAGHQRRELVLIGGVVP